MKNILVTGGAGFIGSHTCLALLEKGYKVCVIDSFINSSPKSLNKLLEINILNRNNFSERLKVFKGDVSDKNFLNNVFLKIKKEQIIIDGFIHFAALKSVADSVLKPLDYWNVNLLGTINILEMMKKLNCKNFVFSSSATIYAQKENNSLLETSEIKPINTYGNTKATIEKLLHDIYLAPNNDFKFGSLRYFNPIGAHQSGLIGEDPKGNLNNIFPLILNTAYGLQKELKIFGNNWPTRDGTAIRDYIHVMDVAESHIKVLEFLIKSKPVCINLNIGTGIGTTVLELIKTFEKVNNIKVPYVFVNRRLGDVCHLVADCSLASSKYNIKPKRTLNDMCRDGWNWRNLNPNGF